MKKRIVTLIFGPVLIAMALLVLVWSNGCNEAATDEGELIFEITPNPNTGYTNPGKKDKLWDLHLRLSNESGYSVTLTLMKYKVVAGGRTMVDETIAIDPSRNIAKDAISNDDQVFTSGLDKDGNAKFTAGQLTYILTGTFGDGSSCEVIEIVNLQ